VPVALLDNPARFDCAMSASVIALPLPSDDFMDPDENYEDMLRFAA